MSTNDGKCSPGPRSRACTINHSEYLQTIDRFYDTGGVFPVDFRGDTEAARVTINAWVEERTRERIRDLIPHGAIGALTRLVLTNAIYFKGEWAEPFKERNTKESDFKLADGGSVVAELMSARGLGSARYAAFNADGSFFDTPVSISVDPQDAEELATYPDENGFAMLELPYKGESLAMILIAPNRPDGLSKVENQFDAETLGRWREQLVSREVHVLLPKFKLETGYEMTAALQALGMERAFKDPAAPGGAEFTGMTTRCHTRCGCDENVVAIAARSSTAKRSRSRAARTHGQRILNPAPMSWSGRANHTERVPESEIPCPFLSPGSSSLVRRDDAGYRVCKEPRKTREGKLPACPS